MKNYYKLLVTLILLFSCSNTDYYKKAKDLAANEARKSGYIILRYNDLIPVYDLNRTPKTIGMSLDIAVLEYKKAIEGLPHCDDKKLNTLKFQLDSIIEADDLKVTSYYMICVLGDESGNSHTRNFKFDKNVSRLIDNNDK